MSITYPSDFQPFLSHSTHKLITKILQDTKKYIFAHLIKEIGIILIHLRQMATVVLAVVIFFYLMV